MAVDLMEIEQRLSSVETALHQVQRRLGLTPASANWVEQIAGSLADIPEDDYQKFMDCCRAVRNGDTTSDAEKPQP
jgi:hypothetical protein